MSLLICSGSRLSDSEEIKFELMEGENKISFAPSSDLPGVFKVEKVAAQLLSDREADSSAFSTTALDLPVGNSFEMPSEEVLMRGYFGQSSDKNDPTPLAESCHSEVSLSESRPRSIQSAPAAIPMDKLKESWSSVKSNRRSSEAAGKNMHSASTTSLESSWWEFNQGRTSSSSTIRRNVRKNQQKLPETPVSMVTDTFLENKTRILGGASLVIGGVGVATAASAGVVVAGVLGIGATAVNLGAHEKGRSYDQRITESKAEIQEIDEELKRTIEQSPSPDTIEQLRRRREELGKLRDSTVAKRKAALTVERGASIAGLANLATSVAAVSDVVLLAVANVPEVMGTLGNGLTVYGAATDAADTIEEQGGIQQRLSELKSRIFGSVAE